MSADSFPGLDFDFLRYIGVQPETQRRIQSFYLPYFEGHNKIIDLGCGDGDLVGLLVERGVDVVGIDSDEKVCQSASARGLPVVQSDIFSYLRALSPESVDAVFSAHLIEHLSYPQVIELIRQSFRVLRPGGAIILATPSVRTLFSHLEMFYLHFGHISFYHPRLLCFFLEHEGFINARHGENPETASPLLEQARALRERSAELSPAPGFSPVAYRREIPLQGPMLWQRLSHRLKRGLARWLVQPFLDDLTDKVNRSLSEALSQEGAKRIADLNILIDSLQTLNGAFECYALACKPVGAPESR